jgi:metallophosphoesterase (TIGR00282 family)
VKVLAIGDVFGSAGRRAVREWLPRLREELAPQFVVVNVENLHNGKGVDAAGARDVLDAGADCMTSGNHVWAVKGCEKLLDGEPRLLRPANYADPCPGRGMTVGVTRDGLRVGVVNLIGRVFMSPADDPFRAIDELLPELRASAEAILVDFHAEATSEKLAMANHVDGRVSAVFGTHTHIQTADARVLPRGTGFITDLGMTGPYDSIIGLDADAVLKRFRTGRPVPAHAAEGGIGLRGALFDIDETNGRCRSVTRVARGAGGQ